MTNAERLKAAGWQLDSSGSWTRDFVVWYTESEALVEVLTLECESYDRVLGDVAAERDALNEALREIGDYAHDRSAGPEVQDDMWEVRRMAYAHLVGGGQ